MVRTRLPPFSAAGHRLPGTAQVMTAGHDIKDNINGLAAGASREEIASKLKRTFRIIVYLKESVIQEGDRKNPRSYIPKEYLR